MIRLAVLLAALASLIGCNSPAQKRELAAHSVRSWNATVEETSEALGHGAVPRGYARQVLRVALEAEQRHSKQPEWNTIPAELRRDLEDAIDRLALSLSEPSSGPSDE